MVLKHSFHVGVPTLFNIILIIAELPAVYLYNRTETFIPTININENIKVLLYHLTFSLKYFRYLSFLELARQQSLAQCHPYCMKTQTWSYQPWNNQTHCTQDSLKRLLTYSTVG